MRKDNEVRLLNSCLNKATDNELIFVLLGRDPAAPVAIRAWVSERIRLEKNKPDDLQILSALQDADAMDLERKASNVRG